MLSHRSTVLVLPFHLWQRVGVNEMQQALEHLRQHIINPNSALRGGAFFHGAEEQCIKDRRARSEHAPVPDKHLSQDKKRHIGTLSAEEEGTEGCGQSAGGTTTKGAPGTTASSVVSSLGMIMSHLIMRQSSLRLSAPAHATPSSSTAVAEKIPHRSTRRRPLPSGWPPRPLLPADVQDARYPPPKATAQTTFLSRLCLDSLPPDRCCRWTAAATAGSVAAAIGEEEGAGGEEEPAAARGREGGRRHREEGGGGGAARKEEGEGTPRARKEEGEGTPRARKEEGAAPRGRRRRRGRCGRGRRRGRCCEEGGGGGGGVVTKEKEEGAAPARKEEPRGVEREVQEEPGRVHEVWGWSARHQELGRGTVGEREGGGLRGIKYGVVCIEDKI